MSNPSPAALEAAWTRHGLQVELGFAFQHRLRALGFTSALLISNF